jgi:hypothetical protein
MTTAPRSSANDADYHEQRTSACQRPAQIGSSYYDDACDPRPRGERLLAEEWYGLAHADPETERLTITQ